MKSSFFATCLAVLLLMSTAMAGVRSGSRWTDLDGGVVTYDSVTHHMSNTTSSTVTDSQGTSDRADGTPTPGGCNGETNASDTMTTNDGGVPPGNHKQYRVSPHGRMQQKNSSGTWKNLKKAKGLQPTDEPGEECGDGASSGPSPPNVLPGGDTIGTHPERPPV